MGIIKRNFKWLISSLLLVVGAIVFFVVYSSADKTDSFFITSAEFDNPKYFATLTREQIDREQLYPVFGHRIKAGKGVVIAYRWFSEGSLSTIDDEVYKKLTIWIDQLVFDSSTLINLGNNSNVVVFYSQGGSAWPGSGFHGYAIRGTIQLTERTGSNLTASVSARLRLSSSQGDMYGHRDLIPDSTFNFAFSCKKLDPSDMIPWLGCPGEHVYDETYRILYAKCGSGGRTVFNFEGKQVADSDIEEIRKNLNLEYLHLSKSTVRDAQLENLPQLKKLRWLDLNNTNISDGGLRCLSSMPNLDYLYLNNTKITDAGLLHIKPLTRLGYLFLHNTRITDSGLENFQNLTKLHTLELNGTSVTGVGLTHLKNLRGLYVLDLSDSNVNDDGMLYIKELKNLYTLILVSTKVTDASLSHLRSLPNLRTLYIGNTSITDRGLEYLKSVKSLSSLNLVGARVTGAGIAELKKALPNLDIKHSAR